VAGCTHPLASHDPLAERAGLTRVLHEGRLPAQPGPPGAER
jgi:hypothetical protein